jgi:hypothetical protein
MFEFTFQVLFDKVRHFLIKVLNFGVVSPKKVSFDASRCGFEKSCSTDFAK